MSSLIGAQGAKMGQHVGQRFEVHSSWPDISVEAGDPCQDAGSTEGRKGQVQCQPVHCSPVHPTQGLAHGEFSACVTLVLSSSL